MSTEQEARDQMTMTAILYRMAVVGEAIPVVIELRDDRKFVEKFLETMARKELVEIDAKNNRYSVTAKGREALTRIQKMTEVMRNLEVFAYVDITRRLQPNEWLPAEGENPEDTNQVLDRIYDPRFPTVGEPGFESIEVLRTKTEDLRLAMLSFLAYKNPNGQETDCDPLMIIFLQKLIDGYFSGKDFWFKLQTAQYYREIEEIVESLYKWREILGPGGSEDGAIDMMTIYYQAGMAESIKRAGHECSKCKTPLGMYEQLARDHKESFDACPICKVSYLPPPPPPAPKSEYSCDNCGSGVSPKQFQCGHCGADLDFGLEPGQVFQETTTTTTTEYDTVWGPGYYYTPYYYDPFDPYLDGFTIGLVFGALLF